MLTLALAAFQRMSGPTHPLGLKTEIDGKTVGFSLPRSGTVGKDTRIAVPAVFRAISGATSAIEESRACLYYRIYPADDQTEYVKVPMHREEDCWVGFLPYQPMAGKLAYYVVADGKDFGRSRPVIIRYRGDVPAGILIPHIVLMFLAMFFAVMAGLSAVSGNETYRKYCILTIMALLLGGFVFGCLVQYHAFGVYWSGFPLGNDLTDNKTLIALLAFLAAWTIQIFRKKARWAVLAASLVMLGIFCVPHSMNGSELDRESGKIESGR